MYISHGGVLALVQFSLRRAVTVLILLALMLTRTDPSGRPQPLNGPQWPFALLVGGGIMAVLVGVAVATKWPGDNDDSPSNIAIETISERLFADYGAPFVLASALLLVALIGPILDSEGGGRVTLVPSKNTSCSCNISPGVMACFAAVIVLIS